MEDCFRMFLKLVHFLKCVCSNEGAEVVGFGIFFRWLKNPKCCNCFTLYFLILGREFFVGLSRRTNQRGAEILADTFKVCRLIHVRGSIKIILAKLFVIPKCFI